MSIDLKHFARRIAELSAYEYKPDWWWGYNTHLGNLPEYIEEILREMLEEYEKKFIHNPVTGKKYPVKKGRRRENLRGLYGVKEVNEE